LKDPEWAVDLANELTALAQPENPDRAALAHLRRGLDHPLDYTLGRVGWLFHRVPDFALEHAVLAAGLFAWTKGDCPHTDRVNFGAAFGTGLTLEQKKQREMRFIDLLDTDRQELRYKLRQAISLIARDSIALDWALLIRHLRYWADADRWVQKKWARGFWAAAEAEPDVTVVRPVSESS
jgi:CRISPR system Cascade subunit CasB